MENQTRITGAPPRMMNAIIAGFNVVANNLALLIIPIFIDLLLWLGPHIRIKKVVTPVFSDTYNYLAQANSPELATRIKGVSEIWDQVLETFNLMGVIRTLPIGVPSLMASSGAVDTPFGLAPSSEAISLGSASGMWLVIIAVGFLAGCVYYLLLARATADPKLPFELVLFIKKIGQSLILTIGFFLLLIILTVPALMLVSVIALISPGLGDFALMFAGFLLIWVLFPLIFTPQAIFTCKTSLLTSILTSVRMIRHFLPGAGIFVIISLIITQGMDVLWRVPPASSWMTLIGIIGHAFIYTAIFAASFVYFRSGLRWMLENVQTARPKEVKT